MGSVKNVSGAELDVPFLGMIVEAGRVVEVPDDYVYGFTQQTGTWEPADPPSQQIHDDETTRIEAIYAAETGTLDEPAGNASTAAWAAWVIGTGRAELAEVAAMGRDELRDTYGTAQADGGADPQADPQPDGGADHGQQAGQHGNGQADGAPDNGQGQ